MNPSWTRRLIALSLLMLATGCVETMKMNQVMSSWEGRDMKQLVAFWGQPTTNESDGNGGRVLTYVRYRSVTTPDTEEVVLAPRAVESYPPVEDGTHPVTQHAAPRVTTVERAGSTTRFKQTRTFWVDANGKIFRTAWHGARATPDRAMEDLKSGI